MNAKEISDRLRHPSLMCYTVVVMALKDISNHDYNSAIARLRVDADKIRAVDKILYKMIIKGEQS
jgi:hypothetical protein